MTRDEMADRIKYTLGLQDDTTFSETEFVNDLIYEAITDISARTRPHTRMVCLRIQGETAIHDMSDQIISLLDISYNGKFLDRYTREDITDIQARGGSGYAYEEPLLWISPIPAEPTVIDAFGVFRPKKMDAGDQSPSDSLYGGLATEFHPTILTYCFWKGGEYMQHEASGNGEKWRVQYEGQDGNGGEIGKIKKILSKRVTPGGPRRRNPARTIGRVPDASFFMGG